MSTSKGVLGLVLMVLISMSASMSAFFPSEFGKSCLMFVFIESRWVDGQARSKINKNSSINALMASSPSLDIRIEPASAIMA